MIIGRTGRAVRAHWVRWERAYIIVLPVVVGLAIALPLLLRDTRPFEERMLALLTIQPGVPFREGFDDGAFIGQGTTVWHFCHVLTGAVIGRNCTLGQNVMIGANVMVGA